MKDTAKGDDVISHGLLSEECPEKGVIEAHLVLSRLDKKFQFEDICMFGYLV